jgi:hypothetical protein
MKMKQEHRDELTEARQRLENPGFTARASDLLGDPIEKGLDMLPKGWSERIGAITRDALMAALKVATRTLSDDPVAASPKLHSFGAALAGAAGGAFGWAALPIELPLSTTIMLRSIADIARANGESVADIDTQLACLMVFSMGGKSSGDDAAESGYFATRIALTKSMADAASYLAQQGAINQGAPAVIRFISLVAQRFNVQVTHKVAATTVPVIGAASGALLNMLFINHYQEMARGHFTVRRLERIYGEDKVRIAYDKAEG